VMNSTEVSPLNVAIVLMYQFFKIKQVIGGGDCGNVYLREDNLCTSELYQI
jgi:hypothetical protein